MTVEATDMEREENERLRAASDWVLRLQNPERSEETVDEWLRWCDTHCENFNTFQRLQQSWRDLESLKPYAHALRSTRSAAAIPLLREEGSGEAAGRRMSYRRSASTTKKRRIALALAAGTGAIVLAVTSSRYFHLWPGRADEARQLQQVTATLISRATTLPDGSKLILGTESRVSMNFEGPQRRLDLSSGQAYFKVKHDRARPFVVQAGDVSVTAIGTAFDVRRTRSEVIVTVEEGTVDVSSAPANRPAATWRAQAGYQLTYSTRDRSASVASVSASEELAWRGGELAYVREPLASVVEDLNRYSPRKVVLEDAKTAQIRFTGTAFASSLEDWAAGIAQIYPVEVRQTPSGDILLRSRE